LTARPTTGRRGLVVVVVVVVVDVDVVVDVAGTLPATAT
jgi:hypothetical protein